MPSFQRGATPSPRHKLAAALPHVPVVPTPPTCLYKPSQLSMWLNDVDGDCVTAEEAFAKACNSPEIFISDSEVNSWATAHGVLNGADLATVLEWMETDGFVQNNNTYNDGTHVSVDWTNSATLQNAISQGPVKIGIAADQLQTVIEAVSGYPVNGWVATGFTQDTNEDHCVSLCGYGTAGWLAQQLNGALPSSLSVDSPAYALFTWSSIGIIDVPSLLAICGEAWLRTPTTVIKTA